MPIQVKRHKGSQRRRVVAGLMLLIFAARVCAEEASKVDPDLSRFQEMLYKGVAGKVLDSVPMDPEHRLGLQRTNAVVSNTLGVRSFVLWLGFTNPIFQVMGLAWGVFAASNIKQTPNPSPALMAIRPRTGSSIENDEQTSRREGDRVWSGDFCERGCELPALRGEHARQEPSD
jgi:hypothetical protein